MKSASLKRARRLVNSLQSQTRVCRSIVRAATLLSWQLIDDDRGAVCGTRLPREDGARLFGICKEAAVTQKEGVSFSTASEVQSMSAIPGGVNGKSSRHDFMPRSFSVADPDILVLAAARNVTCLRIEVFQKGMKSLEMSVCFGASKTGN